MRDRNRRFVEVVASRRHGGREPVRRPAELAVAIFAATVLAGTLAMTGAPNASAEIEDLQRRHAELAARLTELDASVRARVRRDLLDQIAGWRTGLDEFDSEAFRARLAQALEIAASYGMDTDRLSRLYEAGRQVVLRADFSAQNLAPPSGPLERLSQFINRTRRHLASGADPNQFVTADEQRRRHLQAPGEATPAAAALDTATRVLHAAHRERKCVIIRATAESVA